MDMNLVGGFVYSIQMAKYTNPISLKPKIQLGSMEKRCAHFPSGPGGAAVWAGIASAKRLEINPMPAHNSGAPGAAQGAYNGRCYAAGPKKTANFQARSG